jgi:hypothetical protein
LLRTRRVHQERQSGEVAERQTGGPAPGTVEIILTGHWATTDDMIADLIAGGLMLAFGVLVLMMWSFQR